MTNDDLGSDSYYADAASVGELPRRATPNNGGTLCR
jgi:hypothetical protein